jgi:ADP-heptose:LPS heptosyltransferase
MLEQRKKILIIKHGAFGDLIQADGVLRDIRSHYPFAETVLLTSPIFKSLMERSPYIDRIIIDSRASLFRFGHNLRLAQRLRRERFNLVIDLQNSDRSRLYQRYFLPNIDWIGRTSGPAPESGLKGLVSLLKQANIPVHHAFRPHVDWMADNPSQLLQRYLVRSPYIVLIPGCSSEHPEKRWPYYAQLGEGLLAQGFDVVNILGPDELNMADYLPGHCLSKQHGLFNWFELAGIIQHACFVIGNDTGPSHVASCLGKPGLALFGRHTSVARSEIRRGEFRALKVNDLNQLSVETVLASVLPKLPTPIQPPTKPVHQSSY